MTELLDEMVRARLGWTSAAIRSWYADDRLAAQLRNGLAQEAGRVGDTVFGQELRDVVGLPVPDPSAWANRRLELPDGGWAVTGIRFRGGDVDRPFVDVVATTAPATVDGLAVVADAVVPAYQAFAPVCLRVDAPDPDVLVEEVRGDVRYGPRCAVDMYVAAGPVARLRDHARAGGYASLTLRRGDPDELAATVADIYRELGLTQPELAMWADPEDADSLRECAAEGLLFEVLVDGEPGGVVASVRYDAHGMAGFSVQELALDARHRGRRLAAATVQRLVDELPSAEGDVLWGTIHPANAPSLRNALSVGRTIVGGYVWVTPAGLPGMPLTVA